MFNVPSVPPPNRKFAEIIKGNISIDQSAHIQYILDRFETRMRGEMILDGFVRLDSGVTYAGSGLKINTTSQESGFMSGPSFNSGDMFTINGWAISSYYGHRYNVMRDVCFSGYNAAVPWESAGYDGQPASTTRASGFGLKLIGAHFSLYDNLLFTGMYDGVIIDGGTTYPTAGTDASSIVTFKSPRFLGNRNRGIVIGSTGNASGGLAGLAIYDILTDNGSGFGLGAGIHWITRDAVVITGGVILHQTPGFLYEPLYQALQPNGVTPGVGFITDLSCDTCWGWGFDIKNCAALEFKGCESGYNASGGVRVQSPDTDSFGNTFGKGLTWLGGKVIGNSNGASSGAFYIASGNTDFDISHALIGGNVGNGMRIASTVSGGRLAFNRFANSTFGYAPGNTFGQPYGFEWGGSHQNMIIVGNDTRGNGTGNYTGTAPTDGASGNHVGLNTWN